MSRLSLALVVLGILSFESAALAQRGQVSAITKPCTVDESPGRPTLKRRLPTPDDPTSASDHVENTEPCDPPGSPDLNDNQETAKISFQGLNSISESDLRQRFREKRITLPKDWTLEPNLVQKAEEAIKEFLTGQGYLHPTVYTRVDKIEGASNGLVFVVDEGPRFGIGEVRFEGNRIFSSQLLAAKMREYLARFEMNGHEGYD